MPHRPNILTPDAQYDDGGTLEKEVGGDIDWHIFTSGDVRDIPDDILGRADALVTWHVTRIDESLIDRLTACRIIVRAGVGIEHIDLAAAGRRGIPVCNTPDSAVSEVADHAIGLLLSLRRGIALFDRRLSADPRGGFDMPPPPLLKRNRGCVFGIVGIGAIGLATAMRAKALGMHVLAYDPYAPAGIEIAADFHRTDEFDELLSQSDAISVHCPLTNETRGLFGKSAFYLMKREAILINTARGGIVDIPALISAIRENRIGGAALDVFPNEPLGEDDPLAAVLRDNDTAFTGRLVVTPHMGWRTPESLVDVRRFSARTAVHYLRYERLRNLVNGAYLDSANVA